MPFFYPLREACQSLSTHKSRTLSMGFGVLWGIFVLVLLLGTGNGFHNGISEVFKKFGEKTMVIWAGQSAGRMNHITTALASNFPEKFSLVQQSSPLFLHYSKVIYQDKVAQRGRIMGLDRCYASIANVPIQAGRFFTTHDEEEATNLCILGLKIKKSLFGEAPAVGKYVLLDGICLQVVGVLDELDVTLNDESNAVLVTNSFLKRLLPDARCYVDWINLTLMPGADENLAEAQFRAYFSRHLNFDVKDEKAMHVFSMAKHAAKFHNLFKNIATFVWIIGVCFLITGIVGIANMMLVTIQERTQEIAIRKVLGGRSVEIVAMILWEVAIVTFVAGIVGFTAGFSLIQLINKWIVPLYNKKYYLSQLTCPPEYILGGLGLIFLSSCVAGIVPAIKAVKIKPVEALGSK